MIVFQQTKLSSLQRHGYSPHSSGEKCKMNSIQNWAHYQLHKRDLREVQQTAGGHCKPQYSGNDLRPNASNPQHFDQPYITRRNYLLQTAGWFTNWSKTPLGSGVDACCRGSRAELSTCLRSNHISGGKSVHWLGCGEICGIRPCALSDRKVALNAFGFYPVTSKLVLTCPNEPSSIWWRLNTFWIPGNIDLVGNEAAISLARQSVASDHVGPVHYVLSNKHWIRGLQGV